MTSFYLHSTVFESPEGEALIAKMNPVQVAPPARIAGHTRSTLLVAGVLSNDGKLTMHQGLLQYRVTDGKWISDNSSTILDIKFTHWIYAEDQNKIFG